MAYITNKKNSVSKSSGSNFKTSFRLSDEQESFIEKLKNTIKSKMSPDLYVHSISTLNYAAKLADIHLKKAAGMGNPGQLYYRLYVASILHDYGKIFDPLALIEIAEKEKIRLSKFEMACKPLLHGYLAPYLIKRDFGIKDAYILNAAKIHTIGSCKMNILDKILYISDKIEETRDYGNVDYLRKLSHENINLCLLEVYKSNIMYLITENKFLHPDTNKIWNYILGGIKNGAR